jgi:uncharacterized RDD family membrane protein YckC
MKGEQVMSVTTQVEYATIGNRFLALFVDSLIIGLVVGIIGATISATMATTIPAESNTRNSGVSFIVGLIYYSVFLLQWNGQTPGKRLMKVRVVKADGRPLTFADVFMRYIGYYLNSLVLLLGWIWAFFDSQRQGWHDKLARTYVIPASDD